MKRALGTLLVLATSLGIASGRASADSFQFSKGALIIPMQSTFQQPGGMVSAYGLVYRILQANAEGHRNHDHPVTVYVVNNDSKTAPNRCIPTNFSNRVAGVANPQGSASTWNDGCDFTIAGLTGPARQPVTPVDYSIAFPGIGNYPDAKVPTYDDANAWPRYNWSGITLNTAGGFTSISYSGAPFVIDAPDVPAVMDLLINGDTGSNAPPKIATDIFTKNRSASFPAPFSACDERSTTTATATASTPVGTVTYSGGCHFVVMHQANNVFTANITRRINRAPKPFLLFNPSTQGAGPVLDKYLKISGLWLSGSTNHSDTKGCAQGDPGQDTDANGNPSCTLNGSTCPVGAECPADKAFSGLVVDEIHDNANRYTSVNYPKGIVNRQVNNAPYYHLYWAPHWDGAAGDAASVSNLVNYVNQAGTALMTECASITLLENGGGGDYGTDPTLSNAYGGPANGSNFLFTNGISVGYEGSPIQGPATVSGPNCSDPEFPAAGTNCANYPNAANLFSQVGDWKYTNVGGANAGYAAATGSARQAWNQPMVTTTDGTTSEDAFDLGQQDSKHAVVVYVAGHDVSGIPNGSRIVLNSMLNLSGDPLTSERAVETSPVIAYARSDSATTYLDELLVATFQTVSGYSTNPAVLNYTPGAANLWAFPYYPGSFKVHDLATLGAGEQDFNAALNWDADQVSTPSLITGRKGIAPTPGLRNLFTYFGGYPKYNPPLPANSATPPHNILQWNWTPETVDGNLLSDGCTSVGTLTTGCVDVMGFSSRVTSPTYDDKESGLHMVVGADGLCDLSEALNLSNLNSGNDWGGGACEAHNIRQFLKDAPNVAMMLQEVRGYCYAGAVTSLAVANTALLDPVDTACLDGKDNRAHLGGLVHSTPAVVPPSPHVVDLGAKRPTVAYVGGLDGQLHAFYVGGGSGYKGPDTSASPVSFAQDDDAWAKFKTDWGGSTTKAFAPPAVGTELWSYLPASQLPHLHNNSAYVDSAPVVQDVFADFSGTGLREWHTVVLVSVGQLTNEIFAMDVTNPLHPRLLWDTVGALNQTGGSPVFSPTTILSDALGAGTNLPPASPTPADKVAKWKQGTALYQPYPASDPGRTDTKVYDFQDLGGARGLTIAEIRIGLEPFYVAYATTAMKTGSNGIEVFAIDVVTGQKLWQWEHAYSGIGSHSANAAPSSATVIYGGDGASRILVGDMEGNLWELDARTGANVNVTTNPQLSGCSTATPCEFPAFSTGSTDSNNQPITTNIAVAKVPSNVAAGLALSKYAGATVLLFGTAGADWINNPNSTSGVLHVVLYDRQRVPINNVTGYQLDGTTAWTAGAVKSAATSGGVLQEPFNYTLAAGERLYGNITISGSVVYFVSANGSIGDVMKLSATTAGHTYSVDLGTAATGAPPSVLQGSYATFGGLAVYAPAGAGTAPTSVIGSEVSKINVISTSTTTNAAPNAALSSTRSGWTSRLRNWLSRYIK